MSPLPSKILQNTLTVEPFLGEGAKGPRYGPPADKRCRLDSNERVTIMNGRGAQVVSRAVAYVRPENRLANQSRVTIDGIRYEVLDVEPITGPTRIEGYRVVLG